MRKQPNIFKLAAFFLCLLYLLSSLGVTACACTCANSTQLSFMGEQTKHSCTCAKVKKQPCCAKKQTYQSRQGWHLHLIKKSCCTTQTIALKAEHQPEQVRLNISTTDFPQPILFADAIEVSSAVGYNDIIGSLSRCITPPKIPLIYRHSCLRL